MRKRDLNKLSLNKETIAILNSSAMKDSLGGAKPSKIGNSCHTGVCCYSRVECEFRGNGYGEGDPWNDVD